MSRPGPELYVLLGDPVEHSLSPAIHNTAIRSLGIEAVYTTLPISGDLVAPVMRAVAAAGGGGNVTVPHKRVAAAALDQTSDAVQATGACNLFWWEGDRGLCGDNSDVQAFIAAARALTGSELTGRRILLLGAGGAARAVLYGALSAGAATVTVVNRTPARAEQLLAHFGNPPEVQLAQKAQLPDLGPWDLAVNATTLGLQPDDSLPLDPNTFQTRAVLDLVYRPDSTEWVRRARETEIPAEDGRRMLVLQAATAFERWFQRDAPIEVMLDAVGLASTG